MFSCSSGLAIPTGNVRYLGYADILNKILKLVTDVYIYLYKNSCKRNKEKSEVNCNETCMMSQNKMNSREVKGSETI